MYAAKLTVISTDFNASKSNTASPVFRAERLMPTSRMIRLRSFEGNGLASRVLARDVAVSFCVVGTTDIAACVCVTGRGTIGGFYTQTARAVASRPVVDCIRLTVIMLTTPLLL